MLTCQANVIIHHAPPEIACQEICSCPSYEVYTSRNIFELDYELKFDLYRMGKDETKTKVRINNPEIPMICAGSPKKVDNFKDEWKEVTNNREGAGGMIENLYKGVKGYFLGEAGILYSLLGKNLVKAKSPFSQNTYSCPTSIESKSSETNLYFRRVGAYDKNTRISVLENETKGKFLKERGITLNDEDEPARNLKNLMFHPLSQHINAILLWRKMPVWRGNYYLLHEQMAITESISASGNHITIEGSGLILGRVNELVTAKIGGDDQTKGFLSMLVTTATTVASVALPAVGAAIGAGKLAMGAAKAGVNLAGGMGQMAVNQNMSTPSYEETNQTMSIHEFVKKYFHSGERPLSLQIEYNQELFDQYLNKRELKGPMLYTYKNLNQFGDILTKQAEHPSFFLKASVISWNMKPYSEWFREKIESGVYIYDENHRDFYQRKLTGGKTAVNRGGISRKTLDVFVSMTSCGIKGGYDSKSHLGGGFWVYKIKDGRPNYIKPRNGGPDFLLDIMRELKTKYSNLLNSEDSEKWVVNHPEPIFSDYRWDVPDQYKDKTLEDGTKACDIIFRLDFFSGGDDNKEGEKFDITHILVSKQSLGTESALNFNLVGEIVRRSQAEDMRGIPPSTQLPTDPNTMNIPESTPFNPNQFPKSGNLTPSPSGSGEIEINIPSIDNSYDPDFGQDLGGDIDPGQDPDPTKDPDQPTDTGPAPDWNPDDDND